MGKAKRKMRPQPPWWWTLDNDNCWFCKSRNNCGGCKLLKRQRSVSREKRRKNIKKMVKNWAYDEEYGNLCPECLKKLRKEAQ